MLSQSLGAFNLLKFKLTFVVLAYFIIGYLLANYLSSFMITKDVSTIFDRMTPFTPVFILVYASGYLMPILPALLIKNEILFKQAIIAYVVLLTISFVCFLIYPVFVERPNPVQAGLFTPLFVLLHMVDGPYNGLPSLHVSLALTAAFSCMCEDRKYFWLAVWALAIAISALLVKQHVIADVVSGVFLACIVSFFAFRRLLSLMER